MERDNDDLYYISAFDRDTIFTEKKWQTFGVMWCRRYTQVMNCDMWLLRF